MRISLARALFVQPTLLLLDEPTNHLDLRAVLWLEAYLCIKWKKTLIVVSHDRVFLETVCNEIIHLHDLKLYPCSRDFELAYKQHHEAVIKARDAYEKQMRAARKSGSRDQQEKVKARVVFTSIGMSKTHILLLDEPTNHLDSESIDALAAALKKFSGGVVLVSHDYRLISSVCEDKTKSQTWVVENGTARTFPGTFKEYKDELLKEIMADFDD